MADLVSVAWGRGAKRMSCCALRKLVGLNIIVRYGSSAWVLFSNGKNCICTNGGNLCSTLWGDNFEVDGRSLRDRARPLAVLGVGASHPLPPGGLGALSPGKVMNCRCP